MWIAIVVERDTTVIGWNVADNRDTAVAWVRDKYLPKDANADLDPTAALWAIEEAGFDVQIEEVTHLVTTVEYGVRFPNEMVRNCRDDHAEAYALQRAADETLRRAYSPERTVVVERSVLATSWREVQ